MGEIVYMMSIIAFVIGAFAYAVSRIPREPEACRRTGKYCGKAEDCVCSACKRGTGECRTCDFDCGCGPGSEGG